MYAMNYAGQVLHNPRTDIQVLSAELKEESGQSPTLTFKVAPTHPLWSTFGHDCIMAIEHEVELKEVESGEILFRGRVRSASMTMDGAKKIVCEGSLAYLNDTTVRPYKTYDTTEIDCPINAPAEADKVASRDIKREEDFDVVVVGAGISGLMGALDTRWLQNECTHIGETVSHGIRRRSAR